MIRSIKRNIARNRMRDMGFDKINKRMRTRLDPENSPRRIVIRKLEKTRQGRGKLALFGMANPQLWKEVLNGRYQGDAEKAFRRASQVRLRQRHPNGWIPRHSAKKTRHLMEGVNP